MEHDLVFKIIMQLPYPIVYRHDRTVYNQHPELDPLLLLQRCAAASFAGYWVGKFRNRREMLFAAAFSIPLIAKFLYDEWKLSDSLRKYDSFSIHNEESAAPKAGTRDPPRRKASKEAAPPFKPIRPFPKLQRKIYKASDFISQLDQS